MLSPELMSKIRRIEIRTRRLVNDSFAGDYHSIFKGRGMAFDEVRPYMPGDEVRDIDWNVTARMDFPFIKRYVEERELTVILVVDASASGEFGSVDRFKRELAAELGSALAFAATTNNDRVGLLIFTDRVELLIPPRKGRRHVLRLIRDLLAFEPQGRGTDLKLALDTINQILKRHSIVFLISDFLAEPENYRQAMYIANRKHDIIAIDLNDPLEGEIADVGLIALEDAETGELLWVDTGSRPWRERFRRTVQDFEASKRAVLNKAGVDHVVIDAGQDYALALTRFFQTRVRRLRREGAA